MASDNKQKARWTVTLVDKEETKAASDTKETVRRVYAVNVYDAGYVAKSGRVADKPFAFLGKDFVEVVLREAGIKKSSAEIATLAEATTKAIEDKYYINFKDWSVRAPGQVAPRPRRVSNVTSASDADVDF